MLRFVVLLVVGFLLFMILRATVRSFLTGLTGTAGGGRRATGRTRDELVKDPVCQTYVPRSRAIARQTDSGPRYFCSGTCAERFLAGSTERGRGRS